MITMKEIGALASVSQPTVSLILNGRGEEFRISEETCQRVIRIAREHGYAPNLLAQAMRTGNTGIVGILISRNSLQQIADQYGLVQEIMQIQAAFLLHDQRVMLEALSDDDCQHLQMPKIVTSRLADTIILWQNFQDESMGERYIQELQKSARRIILLDDVISSIDATSVNVDDRKAGTDAADYLWKLGHRSFGLISCQERRSALESRMDAFQERIQSLSQGTATTHRVNAGDRWSITCGAKATAELLRTAPVKPTAIFAANDFFAYGAETELLRMGLRIPQDVSLLGVGEWYGACNAQIPITTISVELPRKIQTLLQLCQEKIPQARKKRDLKLVGKLLTRNTTAAPPKSL
ncbi:MAG: LacI family DNA-binding transcriptional regulator [Oligosphaeraceae bacterium]